jgi:hypothetical protein
LCLWEYRLIEAKKTLALRRKLIVGGLQSLGKKFIYSARDLGLNVGHGQRDAALDSGLSCLRQMETRGDSPPYDTLRESIATIGTNYLGDSPQKQVKFEAFMSGLRATRSTFDFPSRDAMLNFLDCVELQVATDAKLTLSKKMSTARRTVRNATYTEIEDGQFDDRGNLVAGTRTFDPHGPDGLKKATLTQTEDGLGGMIRNTTSDYTDRSDGLVRKKSIDAGSFVIEHYEGRIDGLCTKETNSEEVTTEYYDATRREDGLLNKKYQRDNPEIYELKYIDGSIEKVGHSQTGDIENIVAIVKKQAEGPITAA